MPNIGKKLQVAISKGNVHRAQENLRRGTKPNPNNPFFKKGGMTIESSQEGDLGRDFDSLPSSDVPVDSVPVPPRTSPVSDSSSFNKRKKKSFLSSENSSNISEDKKEDKNEDSSGIASFLAGSIVRKIVIFLLPSLMVLLIIIIFIASIASVFKEFEGAVGIDADESEISFSAGTLDQQDFYDRVNSLKNQYQTQGKYVDSLKVEAVFHVLERNGANVDYQKMTDERIKEIMDAMLGGDEAFKNNLVSSLIPKYLPKSSQREREDMAEEVFDYIEKYYDLTGKTPPEPVCSGPVSCTYDIKGFYIPGKGNVPNSIKPSDLYVRLMQCGSTNGHNYGGTFGQPLVGEELIPFEKYVLGVAYKELGSDSPAEAIKAQMVSLRSYILARHLVMGGWRTLKKEENGKWVLQVAACNLDPVYCDPDQGCSSNDQQWGEVHSGLNYNRGFSKNALASDSSLRQYATQTQGELLVNGQGYVVYADYHQFDQNNQSILNKFVSLAKKGLNYKQILVQVYNQTSKNYNVSGLQKASCSGTGSNCPASGDYVHWKQYSEPWASVNIGNTSETIKSVGCLATSIAILIKKSGVPTVIENFNPGTFVEKLNQNGGFDQAFLQWNVVTNIIPSFQYQGKIEFNNLSKSEILSKIKSVIETPGVYAVVKVNGEQVNLGTHWVAIDAVNGNDVVMIDPGSNSRSLFSTYSEVLEISYYKVSG